MNEAKDNLAARLFPGLRTNLKARRGRVVLFGLLLLLIFIVLLSADKGAVDAADGAAVLIILHDLNLAAQYADKILILKGGKISAFGSPEKVFTPEVIHEAFGVSVSLIKHPHFDCPLIVWRDSD